MNILLTIAFDGGAYHGFQVQENALAVCEVLQDAMEKVFGARPDVKGCSRTDSGVHALEYCVNFKYETNLPDYKIVSAINFYLPKDVRVRAAKRVPMAFHARYACTGKEYKYVWLNSQVDDPFCHGQYYRLGGQLDENAMHKAGQFLVGKHDFAAFMSFGSGVEDTVRCVTKLEVFRKGERVIMQITADGYLYNMVRIIAGTLLAVGRKKQGEESVLAALQSKDRRFAGETQPAKGLFLSRVFYPESAFEFKDDD